jgi:VWFA-related protein
LHTAFSNLVHVREAMLRLFGEEHEGDAQYTVVLIGSQMSMLRDTTSDPAAVLSALGSKDLEKAYLASRRGSIEAQMAGFRQDLARVRAACDHPGQPGAQAECAAGKLRLQSQADQFAGFERLATIEFLRQFRSLVQQLGAADGRRSIVLVSDGFNMVPGQVAYLLLAACFPEIQGASLRANERIIGELEPILRLAQQKNLPVYTIDSRGLYAMPLYSAAEAGGTAQVLQVMGATLDRVAQSAGDTLQQIAAETGGLAFRNRNDLLTGMERAFADGRDYYMLAYVPTYTNLEKRFHRISITMNDRKLQSRAKSGYWANED